MSSLCHPSMVWPCVALLTLTQLSLVLGAVHTQAGHWYLLLHAWSTYLVSQYGPR